VFVIAIGKLNPSTTDTAEEHISQGQMGSLAQQTVIKILVIGTIECKFGKRCRRDTLGNVSPPNTKER
jgi:hypothetical protein